MFTILYLLLSIGVSNYFTNGYFVSMNLIYNACYLLILMLVIFAYYRLRFKSWKLLDQGLGMGDLIFWIVIACYLDFLNFVIWFNLSLIISLALHGLLREKRWYGGQEKIPLAGLQSFVLIFFVFF